MLYTRFYKANTHLAAARGLHTSKEIQFSDEAPMQYKCAAAFADISFAEEDSDIPVQQYFYRQKYQSKW